MAFGQDAADSVVELNPFTVEVTAVEQDWLKVPYAVSSVGEADIQRGNEQLTLDESLTGIPGVFILNAYNYAQDTRIAIRGFGARADFGIRGIQLVVDGLPATTPDGQGEVDGIDLGSAGKIEVLRGPSAVFYGSASGGVVRIQTEAIPERPFVESRSSIGSYGLFGQQLKAAGRVGGLGYLISSAYLESDGYRNNSGTEQLRLNAKLTYEISKADRLRFVFNAIDYPVQNDPGGLTLEEAEENPRQARGRNLLFDSGETVRQQRIGIQYQRDWQNHFSFELTSYYTHRDFANKLPFEDGGQVSFKRDFYGSSIKLVHKTDPLQWGIGMDFDRQQDSRKNYENLSGLRGDPVLHQDETVASFGTYGFLTFLLGDNLELSAGVRFDHLDFEVADRLLVDGDDSGEIVFKELSPSIGLNWKTGEFLSFYTNISRSYETPTTTEFDNPSGGGFNPELNAQEAVNYEAGIRGIITGKDLVLTYSAAAFHIRIEDALVPFELPQFPDREFFRNAGRSRRDGIEISMETKIRNALTVSLDYTYSDFVFQSFAVEGADFAGNRIPGVPRHFGGISLAWENQEGAYIEWNTRFVSSFYADDANNETVDRYTTSQLSIGYKWTYEGIEIEPYLTAKNLFDQSYFSNIRINAFGGRHYEPAPGRFVFGGIRIRHRF